MYFAYILYLETGEHTLQFVADQSPLLETIKIYQTTSEQNVVFEPVKNYQIESGKRIRGQSLAYL